MILLTDLSEVLIKGVYETESIIQNQYGKKVAKRFLQRRVEINPIFCELMRDHISEDVYWYAFLQGQDWPFGADEMKTILSYNFAERIPGTLEVYQRIIGYPDHIGSPRGQIHGRPDIWLVSDHIPGREIELEYLHPEVFDIVSRRIWSFGCRAIKSDPGFFRKILIGNKLLSDEVVFIDDLSVNIASAENEGIMSIKFKNANQLEADLSELGFVFAKTS